MDLSSIYLEASTKMMKNKGTIIPTSPARTMFKTWLCLLRRCTLAGRSRLRCSSLWLVYSM